MKHKILHRERGFTLIEISIVLVIIGLLLGGVLKGRELIENAKIKRVSNDFNGIAAAVYSYLDRYNAIPGDDGRATARWAAATSGDNNGILETNNADSVDETAQIWDHLRRASLLGGGSGTTPPLHAFGGTITVGNGLLALAGPVICMQGISGNVAEIIDIQSDDGLPATGIFRAVLSTVTPSTAVSAETGYSASTVSYNLCKQL